MGCGMGLGMPVLGGAIFEETVSGVFEDLGSGTTVRIVRKHVVQVSLSTNEWTHRWSVGKECGMAPGCCWLGA